MIAEARLTAVRCPVRLVGGAARRALASSSRWRVFSVFRRSFYCRSDRGSLVCVGAVPIAAGPLAIGCARPGAGRWEDGGLRPEAPVVFSMADARDWRPAALPAGWKRGDLVRGLAELRGHARAMAPTEGLAPLIAETGARTPLVRTAGPATVALGDWLRDSASAPPAVVGNLIGLGPGLTPSGDDFLGGALIGLRALGRRDAADRLAARVLPLARTRTHAISVAHLACAAEGEGMAALHETLGALCSPGAPGLPRCLEAIDAVGHTSGWDALAGLALAAAAVVGAR